MITEGEKMELYFSPRVTAISPSSTLAITEKAKELKASGYDVIGLGAGEPDFNTPQYIIEASYKSMLQGHTKYTPTGGLLRLKEAICNKLFNDQNLSYKPEEIIVTNGAKHALTLFFQTMINRGDEVIIPTPYWVSYPEQVKIAGGIPIYVEAKEENHFKITSDQLEEAITEKTKVFVLNSPSNPTGMMYDEEELRKLGEVCIKHNILIVADEIYEKLVYGNKKHVSIAQLSEPLKEQTVIINGFSKSHSMTGWRIGYAAGRKEIIKLMTTLASHTTSNPAVMAQYGAIAAYENDDGSVEKMRQAFEERLNIVYDKLIKIPGFSCIKPDGAFYLFPNIKEAVENCGFSTADEFAKALLEEAKVAIVPGSSFGAKDNIRLSYATSLELLLEAVHRIHQFVETHMR